MPTYAIVLRHKEGSNSPHSRATQGKLRSAGANFGPVEVVITYLIEGKIGEAELAKAAETLRDPVLESASIYQELIEAPSQGSQLTVLRRGGVMDPVEDSVVLTLKNAGLEVDAVKVAHSYLFSHDLAEKEAREASRLLANEAIEECVEGNFELKSLRVGGGYSFDLVRVPIRELDDDALKALSKARSLSMNIAEMRETQDYFRNADRDPTDVELDMIAQTWSEHCKHKTLTGPVRYSETTQAGEYVEDSLFELEGEVIASDGYIPGLLQTTIKRATDDLNREFCWSVFVDNAGVIAYDEDDGICVKVETHNHPSAIEPYGGAGTGIGGVIRDILGTGLGAKPICNTDVFCFGHLDMAQDAVPKGALHPLRVMRGVVSGVRDYGNRMGIPTVNGAICFDERYTGNPLVYAGCVGLIPRKYVEKEAKPGDKIVAVGGATGRDGIGGATFSSVELSEESETVSSGAVQIGNAIQEKVVLDTMLQARDRGLFNAVTDCGAGGFSSAVGEMGEETGARVELTGAPLKYDGLSYREIWLSEAQERMVFAVPPEKLDEFLAVFAAENVETAVLGDFTDDKQMVVQYEGNTVLDLPMEFLHDGLPKVERSATWRAPNRPEPSDFNGEEDYNDILSKILSSPNVCSKEWVVRQYDHEVQAMSALKPFAGVHRDGPSDASAVVPDASKGKAVLIGCGVNPHYGDVDPFWMAQAAIDEAIRNVVAAGGNPDHCAILDNFSWGNCDKPEQMGAMVRACAGCYVASMGLGAPFISGKDSLNNEFASEGETISIPATLLVTAVSVTPIKHITSMDLKEAGNALYQIGYTWDEMAASHYELVSGKTCREMPRFRPETALACYRALHSAREEGLIRSAHDLSEGGLATALAEMAFAGGLGAEIQLTKELAGDEDAHCECALLFAESNSRIVIEAGPDADARLREIFMGLPLVRIGEVNDSSRLKILGSEGKSLVDADIEDLRGAFKAPLYRAVGEEVPA